MLQKEGKQVSPSLRSLQIVVQTTEMQPYQSAQKGIAGHALLFFNLNPDGTADSLSLHAGCPVIKGEKWSATKWIRVASFDKVYHAQGNCTDDNESCAKWTALGECTKNPEYMVGTAALPGYCRRTCNVC